MALRYGMEAVHDVRLGTTKINTIRYGGALVWTRADHYWFDACGLLPSPEWVNETITEGIRFISDGFSSILTTVGDWYAELVAVVPTVSSALTGGLISLNAPDPSVGICGILTAPFGGLNPNDLEAGIVGVLNGIPIIGPLIAQVLFPANLTDFNSIVGSIPIIGDLGRLLGLIPNNDGTWNNPTNFIVDAIGNVLGWITCGMINTQTVEDVIAFVVGGICNMARMLIPDGLAALDPTSAVARATSIAAADNGHVQTVVGSLGDPGYATKVFRRYKNDGTGGAGVGIHLENSQLGIVRRVGVTDAIVADAGQYAVGDRLLLDQDEDVHILYRNGSIAATWPDNSATAAKGAGYRSMALEMAGAKQHLGPRVFSPGLMMVEVL